MIVLDTNLLVHASVPGTSWHHRSLSAIEAAQAVEPVATTRQCLREYLATMSRPQAWARQPDLAEAIRSAGQIADSMPVLEDGPLVWAHLLGLGKSHRFGGKQVHDANIVATMLAHGARRLLTFNVADFRRFTTLIEVLEPDA